MKKMLIIFGLITVIGVGVGGYVKKINQPKTKVKSYKSVEKETKNEKSSIESENKDIKSKEDEEIEVKVSKEPKKTNDSYTEKNEHPKSTENPKEDIIEKSKQEEMVKPEIIDTSEKEEEKPVEESTITLTGIYGGFADSRYVQFEINGVFEVFYIIPEIADELIKRELDSTITIVCKNPDLSIPNTSPHRVIISFN
ncbi:hypothetical protein [Romboutsia sp.]|uniref:hypothetical protein n=1 Tax=Romboutsia sp. TaxID=1965302 RepID=UPI002C3D8680|nr:hypothetical protein [Romboutsia sp.]HSQ88580.1 hypothetical protein [Romboutsia sp.]